jgi:RimJ/RimL family protein N-acetyltransferase
MTETWFRTGRRIAFRSLEIEDLETCRAWLNDPEIHRFLSRHRPLGRIEEREWLEGLHRRADDVVFGIVRLEDRRLIGNAGLHRFALPNRSAELGIAIGDRESLGRGYGSEAVRLLLDYAFGTLGLHRVGLRVYADNARAIRCYEKCGFRREGVQREVGWREGGWRDDLLYAILESEWREVVSIK